MHFASYYRWLIIRDWLRTTPSDHVLDVGCDDGEIVARLRAAVRTALDLNPRCPDASVHLVRSDARRLPVPTGVFDTVIAFDIIEHIEDDQAVLAELVRVLADDGILWISTPSAGFFIFPPFLTARANQGFGHVRNGYTLTEIRAKLPAGTQIEVMLWNEPVFRFMFVALRILNEFSSVLTHALAALCFWVDQRWRDGLNGHLFIQVRKMPTAPV